MPDKQTGLSEGGRYYYIIHFFSILVFFLDHRKITNQKITQNVTIIVGMILNSFLIDSPRQSFRKYTKGQSGMYVYISYTYTYPSNFWYTFGNQYIYIYTWELEKQVHNSARFNFTKNYLKITFCKAIISKVDQKLDWHVYVYFIYIYIPV